MVIATTLMLMAFSCTLAPQESMGEAGHSTRTNDGFVVKEEDLYPGEGLYRTESRYRNGNIHGEQTRFYPNGRMAFRRHWLDGTFDGEVAWWHKNGKPMSLETYRQGFRHGLRTTWFSNGQKGFEGTYQNGCLTGFVRTWYDNGNPEVEIRLADPYQDDACWPELHIHEKRVLRPEYLARRNGSVTVWNRQGELIRSARYISGQQVQISCSGSKVNWHFSQEKSYQDKNHAGPCFWMTKFCF
ncbi:MAG: toxin-antitoxin system YwqK family antitoxin [Candidatus Ozemobacteraceae bacterium]